MANPTVMQEQDTLAVKYTRQLEREDVLRSRGIPLIQPKDECDPIFRAWLAHSNLRGVFQRVAGMVYDPEGATDLPGLINFMNHGDEIRATYDEIEAQGHRPSEFFTPEEIAHDKHVVDRRDLLITVIRGSLAGERLYRQGHVDQLPELARLPFEEANQRIADLTDVSMTAEYARFWDLKDISDLQ